MIKVLADYLDLIPSANRDTTKFKAWLTDALQLFLDVQACAASMPHAFDVDYAVGAQLDILGEIVGAARTVNFQPTGSVSPILDDATYRILIKAKIALNTWDGQLGSVEAVWAKIFPGGQILVQDNGDMSITVTCSGVFSSIIVDLIEHDMIVPRPEGVLITYLFGTMPFFGFDLDNSSISGWDVGAWA